MSALVIRAEDTAGRIFELRSAPRDEAHAAGMANRIAGLLGAIGDPEQWRGCKVAVVEAVSRRLVAVVRIGGRQPAGRVR